MGKNKKQKNAAKPAANPQENTKVDQAVGNNEELKVQEKAPAANEESTPVVDEEPKKTAKERADEFRQGALDVHNNFVT